jgi:hypothetical protein
MILLILLAATPPATSPDRSWTDLGYDVLKNVASASAVAFLLRSSVRALGGTRFADWKGVDKLQRYVANISSCSLAHLE